MQNTLRSKIYRRICRLFRHELEDCWCHCNFSKSVPTPRLAPNEKIVTTDDADFERIETHLPEIAEQIAERRTHSTGVIMLVDHEYACSMWFTHNKRSAEGTPPFLYEVWPKEGNAYIYDAFTKEKFRSKRHFYKLALFTHDLIRSREYSGMYLMFDSYQIAWTSFYERLGFQMLGIVRYSRTLCFVKRDMKLLKQICRSS